MTNYIYLYLCLLFCYSCRQDNCNERNLNTIDLKGVGSITIHLPDSIYFDYINVKSNDINKYFKDFCMNYHESLMDEFSSHDTFPKYIIQGNVHKNYQMNSDGSERSMLDLYNGYKVSFQNFDDDLDRDIDRTMIKNEIIINKDSSIYFKSCWFYSCFPYIDTVGNCIYYNERFVTQDYCVSLEFVMICTKDKEYSKFIDCIFSEPWLTLGNENR